MKMKTILINDNPPPHLPLYQQPKITYHTQFIFHLSTSLHSSRMRTARLLLVPPSMHCSLAVGCLFLGCLRGVGGGIPACNEADPSLWTEFVTHTSENITLPQTSFAGGNNIKNKNAFQFNASRPRRNSDRVANKDEQSPSGQQADCGQNDRHLWKHYLLLQSVKTNFRVTMFKGPKSCTF